MEIERKWAMPNKETFKIKPIEEWLTDALKIERPEGIVIDPYVRNSIFKKHCHLTNDLSEEFEADYHLEAKEFLSNIPEDSVSFTFFDPPYSPRQISECYKGIGRKVHMTDTQASFYSDAKKIIARITKVGGLVASFGWNSMGIGKTRGFEIVKILLVPHGGAKNDTICTLERRVR